MSDEAKLDDFEVGATYEVEVGETVVPLALKAATALPQSVRQAGSFVLDFRGPPDRMFGQGVYRVRKGTESWDMFLAAHAPEQDGAVYQATYN